MTNRRWFFRLAAAVAALPGSAAIAAPGVARAAGAPGAAASRVYDFPAIAARLARPAPHRQVFAVARVADGAALGYMKHAIDAYETTMGEGPGALHAAAVAYSRGVVLGLNDQTWTRYGLAEVSRRRGEILTAPGAGHPFGPEFAALAGRGASVFVCDNALADLATYLATQARTNGAPIDDVRADLRRNLLPGALLVPAGVAALNMAQEAHFTYVQASL